MQDEPDGSDIASAEIREIARKFASADAQMAKLRSGAERIHELSEQVATYRGSIAELTAQTAGVAGSLEQLVATAEGSSSALVSALRGAEALLAKLSAAATSLDATAIVEELGRQVEKVGETAMAEIDKVTEPLREQTERISNLAAEAQAALGGLDNSQFLAELDDRLSSVTVEAEHLHEARQRVDVLIARLERGETTNANRRTDYSIGHVLAVQAFTIVLILFATWLLHG